MKKTTSIRACSLAILISMTSLVTQAAGTPTTAAFKEQMLKDTVAAVQKTHEGFARGVSRGTIKPNRGYANTLAAMVNLHSITGDAKFLQWAQDDIVALVHAAKKPDGAQTAFINGFRNMVPFCEAYMYLKAKDALTSEQRKMIEDQIIASVATHYDYTDFGPHNRGLIDGAAFLFAAKAVPDAPDVKKWKSYGNALAADSMYQWSIEDASIYLPFWQTYTLTLAELQGELDEYLKPVTTRYYFDYIRSLIMPNGLLPDWGDGDWTHNWDWSVANLVLAGSRYKDGEYLDAARQLYEACMQYWRKLDAGSMYTISTALRWMDSGVPLKAFAPVKSREAIDDLISKKITFRSANGDYAMLNYRDEGAYGRFGRDYLNAQLNAFQEKPHHGHSDENAIDLLMAGKTVLLADGGYRHTSIQTWEDGWRADFYHNKIVARTGQMMPYEGDAFDYITKDRSYHAVQTEKIHFGNFGSLDYSRTRLVDRERGYTGDRIILFSPETSLHIVVDSILIDEPGVKVFCNTWHPDNILKQGDNYVVSWPERIPIRKEYWPNTHNKELLIQFLGNGDKVTKVKEIERRFNPSKVFLQYQNTYFFKGQRLLFVTVLRPHDPGTFNAAMLDDVKLIANEREDGRTLGLTFKLGGDLVTVGLKLDQTIGLTNLRGRPLWDFRTGQVDYGKLRTDSDFAFVREYKDGAKETAFQYGCELHYDGRTLFEMPLNKHMYQGADDFRNQMIKDKMPRWHQIVK